MVKNARHLDKKKYIRYKICIIIMMKCLEGQKLILVHNNHKTVYKFSCILNLDSNHLTLSDENDTVITQDSGT